MSFFDFGNTQSYLVFQYLHQRPAIVDELIEAARQEAAKDASGQADLDDIAYFLPDRLADQVRDFVDDKGFEVIGEWCIASGGEDVAADSIQAWSTEVYDISKHNEWPADMSVAGLLLTILGDALTDLRYETIAKALLQTKGR